MFRNALIVLALAVLAGGCGMSWGDLTGEAVDKAVQTQTDKADEKDAWCPKCGSDDVELSKWGKLGIVVDGLRHKYKCKKCGHEFD